MPELFPIFLALFTGFVAGLVLSMPIGPVNLTIINESTRRGFGSGALVGLGASSMELIYCTIAFTGFTQLFEEKFIKASMEVFTFVFVLYLGQKFLRAKDLDAPTKFGTAAAKFSVHLDQKLHPESSFMTGFVRVMGNLGVLLFWIILAANFLSRDWVEDTMFAKAACVLGVAIGTNSWFCSLSYAASRGYGRLSEPTLLKLERFSGVCLLVLGIAQGIHIGWQLAKHKI